MRTAALDIADPRVVQLLQRLPLATAAVDRDGRVVLINDWAINWSGYTPADTPTLSAWRLKAFPDDAYRAQVTHAWDAAVAQADASGSPIEPRELRVVVKSGEVRSVTVFGIPLAGGFLAVFLDDTDRLRYEAQRREAQALRAVSTLAGGIAHEFNNLLATMLMRLHLAKVSPDGASDWRDEVREVEELILRARALIDELLDFAGRRQPARADVSLREVCEDAARSIRATLPGGVDLRLRVASDAMVWGDRGQLAQLLQNLLANAGEAMSGREGSVSLTLESLRIVQQPDAALDPLAPGAYHLLRVSDEGAGMTREVLERAFDPFFTTKPTGRGTGLGLAVARGIARAHGGGLTCESLPDRGTTIGVYLPVVATR